MRRWIVVAAVVVLVLALPVVAQAQEEEDNTCRPWTTWTPWSVIFCDYSLWDLYEGLLGWIWGDDGASRGWYGEEPPTDGVWTRWCWLNKDDAPICSWSTTFSAAAELHWGPGELGTAYDPPWMINSDWMNTITYVVLVTPPLTSEVTMQCAWVVRAKADGLATTSAWGGHINPFGDAYVENGPGLILVGEGGAGEVRETVVSDTATITFRASPGNVYTHQHPAQYSDYTNYIRWRFGARVTTGNVAESGIGYVYTECEILSITIDGQAQTPENPHKWFEEHGPIEPPGGMQPIGYDRIGFNPITPISQTIEFDVGTPGVPACLPLVPQVGPYTVTIPTWGDWGVGWDSFEICVRESQFTLKLLDINFGSWIISLFLLAGAFFLVRVIMT